MTTAITLGFACTGCWTQAFLATEAACQARGFDLHPAAYEGRLITDQRVDQVPTGAFTCVSTSEGQTTTQKCTPETKDVIVDFTRRVTVDTASQKRAAFVKRCTRDACMEAFGNAACKAEKSPSRIAGAASPPRP